MIKTIRICILVVLPVLVLPAQTLAQADTINISKNGLQTQYLKEGLHQYLVYFENPKKQKIGGMSLWNRQVNFKTVNGIDAIEIVQHWYLTDTLFNRYVYSISDKKNFRPVYHYTKNSKGIEAFDFNSGNVKGSDTVVNNAKKDFTVASNPSTLNWELDLEILSTLPYKKVGQQFLINFYHPGGRTEPRYYKYEVIGSEKIEGIGKNTLDCWKLKIDYDQDSWAIFWINKSSRDVLKMQEYYKGNYRYKVKLATPVGLKKI